MSKVLFVTRKNNTNPALNKKIMEEIDCQFTFFDAKNMLSIIQTEQIKMVVLFISKLETNEDLEVGKFLANCGAIPVVMAGEAAELKRYYNKTKANILRYISTPILLSSYMKELKKILCKIEGGNNMEETKDLEIEISEPPKHILVIDDDIVMLRTINNWLRDLFKVSVVRSGAEALQFLSKSIPDLILLDYDMPICDGIQTLKMIRSIDNLKNIPVFFLTGVDDDSQVKRAIELKPQGYILKSQGADYLISKIEKFF